MVQNFFELMILMTAIPVLLLLGLPILRAGLASLLRGQPNIHTLITIGAAFSAFGISVWNYARGHTLWFTGSSGPFQEKIGYATSP